MSFLSWFFKKKPKNNRQHPRVFGAGIRVRIDSHIYFAEDASISGIKLKKPRQRFPEGLLLNVRILLTIASRQEALPARALVLRCNADELVLRFKKLPPRTKRIYCDFINVSALDFDE